jgi:hypothetical protein
VHFILDPERGNKKPNLCLTMGRPSFVGGFLLGAAASTALAVRFYQTQIVKKKKDEYSFHTSKTGVVQDEAGFLTDILRELWPNLKVVAENAIRDSIVPMLATMSPKIDLVTLDLGNFPIRMDNVMVQKRLETSVQFDLDLVWEGTDVTIAMKTMLGSFGISAVHLKGRMSILLKPLTNASSLVNAVQYTFINTPDLRLVFSGLAAVAEMNVLEAQIGQILRQTLEGMVVLPVRMSYKLDAATTLMDMYQPPLGFARVTLCSGRGFVVEKRTLLADDIPDVYGIIKLGSSTFQTSTVTNSLEPVWDPTLHSATVDFLLSDYDQMLEIQAWDEDNSSLDADDELGACRVTIGELLLCGGRKEMELRLDGMGTGAYVTVQCDPCPLHPGTVPKEPAPVANHKCGLLTILITKACQLPLLAKGTNSIYVEITVDGVATPFLTSAVDDSPGSDPANPQFDATFEIPVDKPMGRVTLNLKNGKTTIATSTVGLTHLPKGELVEKKPVKDSKDGYFEYAIYYRSIKTTPNKPASATAAVAVAQSTAGSLRGTATASGKHSGTAATQQSKVRISVVRGYGFKVQKLLFQRDDVPDVYCRVEFGGIADWRTKTVKDTTAPLFNESRDFLFTNANQTITIDVFDQDQSTSEDLGRARVTVGKLLFGSGHPVPVEIEINGKGSGAFLELAASMV